MKKMLKVLCLSVASAMLFSLNCFSAPAKSEVAAEKTANIYKGTPKIDGVGNDACWKTATIFNVKKYISSGAPDDNGNGKTYATGVAKVCWDEKNLYVYIQVKDNTQIKNMQVDYQSDSVEYFIDGDNSKSKQNKPVVNAQYRLNIDGKVTGYGDYNRTAFKKTAKCVKVKGGYNQEVAIPLTSHGITAAKAGMKMGFDIQINDNAQGKTRDYMVSWYEPNTGWNDPSTLGTVTLK